MLELIKTILLTPSFYILVIMFIVYPMIYPKIVGWFGELYTKRAINKLPKNDYFVINNLFLKNGEATCQIDHLVLSKYGIFVIESKQYNGYITGDKNDKKWIRHYGRKKIYYENPIRQNYGHIKFLSSLLNMDEKYFYNLVCISSRAKLKVQHEGELVSSYSINDTIMSHREVYINDVDKIYDFLLNNIITDKKELRKHIKRIQTNLVDYNYRCPKCGGQLVERSGKYGSFYGCSNYPKCNFTKK